MAYVESHGKFIDAEISIIIMQVITDLEFSDGRQPLDTRDAQVVLASGAGLVQMLADSGIDVPPEHQRPVATAILAYVLHLSEDQVNSFRDRPIFSQAAVLGKI